MRARIRVGTVALLVATSAWLLRATPHARAQAAVPLDGLAAVIGGDAPGPGVDTVLRSDIELRARIAWAARQDGDAAHDPLPNSLLAAALQEIIGEHLIAREAKRVQAATPTGTDIERERRRLYKNAGGPDRMQALLAAIGASEGELDQIARRRALVGAFLSANLEGVTVVTDAEVEQAYEHERDAFAGREREAALSELRARLSREALDRTIERWVAVLGTRTPVRVYVSY
jgi:hypothetical protein